MEILKKKEKEMKEKENWIPIIVLLIVALVVFSGLAFLKKEKGEMNEFIQGFAAPHKLQRLFEFADQTQTTETEWSASGGFFLLIGGAIGEGNSSSFEETRFFVELAFERHDLEDTYAIVKLPLERINVNIVTANQIPTINFHLKNGLGRAVGETDDKLKELYYNDLSAFFSEYLAFAVITVHEDNWPKKIEMLLDKEKLLSQ